MTAFASKWITGGAATRFRFKSIPTGLLYYPGVRCPACGGRHFAIGRVTAECAGCDAALILSNPSEEQ